MPPETETGHALVDTEAAESYIDSRLAEEPGLPITDKKMCSGAGGASEHNVYMAEMALLRFYE